MDLQVATHRDLASVESIAAEWQALHDEVGDPNPFSGPDWPLTWLRHFGETTGSTPFVVAVRDGGRLVGVAPLVRRPVARATAHILTLIGAGDPYIGLYELPSLLVTPTAGRAIARAVVAELCDASDGWDWSNLTFGTSVPWFEPEWLPNWSYTVVVRRIIGEVVLDLSAERDHLAGRRNLKESIRRAHNRLTRDFGVDGWAVRRVHESDEVPAAFDRLVDLHRQRARTVPGRPVHADVFMDPVVHDYVRDVVVTMAKRASVSIYELLVGTNAVASQLVLSTAEASYNSVSGVSDQAWPYSAITYLQACAVTDAQDAGHRRVSMSIGPNQTKLRWTDTVSPVVEFAVVGPRARSRLLYLLGTAWSNLATFREARAAHRD